MEDKITLDPTLQHHTISSHLIFRVLAIIPKSNKQVWDADPHFPVTFMNQHRSIGVV